VDSKSLLDALECCGRCYALKEVLAEKGLKISALRRLETS
jgi:hypothetical protein